MAGEVQLADDLGPQQRDDVGADGELEAGEHFLGDRCAAEHVTPLEDEDLASRAGEVGGVDESVVAAADHDGVVAWHGLGDSISGSVRAWCLVLCARCGA